MVSRVMEGIENSELHEHLTTLMHHKGKCPKWPARALLRPLVTIGAVSLLGFSKDFRMGKLPSLGNANAEMIHSYVCQPHHTRYITQSMKFGSTRLAHVSLDGRDTANGY